MVPHFVVLPHSCYQIPFGSAGGYRRKPFPTGARIVPGPGPGPGPGPAPPGHPRSCLGSSGVENVSFSLNPGSSRVWRNSPRGKVGETVPYAGPADIFNRRMNISMAYCDPTPTLSKP